MRLDDKFLDQFIHTFYGSGTYDGSFWFVGMEEGGGGSLDKVLRRLEVWKKLGGSELVDLSEFHFQLNMPEYFTNPVKLQRTWMQQARIVLIAQNKSSTIADLRAYQKDMLGRKNKETCLLELLPLPSPSTSIWNYDVWSGITFLKNRKKYREYCLPWRGAHIRSQILAHQPPVVIFCGFTYKSWWQQIAGPEVCFVEKSMMKSKVWIGKHRNTLFLITKHPAARGITNDYFEFVGSLIVSHFP